MEQTNPRNRYAKALRRKYEAIVITRNPEYLTGQENRAFVVIVKRAMIFNEYKTFTFDEAVAIAREQANLYRINYTIERGL